LTKNTYIKFVINIFVFIILLVFTISNNSCGNNKKERFINTTVELLTLQYRFPNDSNIRKNEAEKIYEKFGLSTLEYKELYESYRNNNQEFIVLMDTIKARIKQEILLLETKKQ